MWIVTKIRIKLIPDSCIWVITPESLFHSLIYKLVRPQFRLRLLQLFGYQNTFLCHYNCKSYFDLHDYNVVQEQFSSVSFRIIQVFSFIQWLFLWNTLACITSCESLLLKTFQLFWNVRSRTQICMELVPMRTVNSTCTILISTFTTHIFHLC